ncbi:MAG: DUF3847 domain-containing protein [Tissierellaceae bacterium]|jgi:hypothetical protein|nr:DUF3847 domain-containing protein [Tissierellaceae bacterium]
MAKTRTEKIESIQDQIAQLENQRKRLVQQQKEQERKDRTKRLCKRMGLFESMLPNTIPLTDEQFKTFLEKTVATDQCRRLLAELTVQGTSTALQNPTELAPHSTKDEGENGATAQG